ncbi:uncharacterized protein LOC135962121 [Calliphora vicina]|uniref:uncharacterized protein LOC135962121 n=1 Tax=Calliphora vicina TaxID=7373 RepID=UPI00325BAC90
MLSLVADYDTTSSSSSDEYETEHEGAEVKQSKTVSSPTTAKLSTPLLLPSANLLLSRGSSKSAGDVFSNPFLEAEKLEIDKLQKHVKMVDSENHLLQKNGRKICWNNRKGRCRFGNKCKYAHDSDLVDVNEVADGSKQIVNKEFKTTAATNPFLTKSSQTFEDHTTEPGVTESNDKLKNRKRAGLGDSIVPGKRVMKTYNQTKKST